MSVHVCRESTDPRNAGRCSCGSALAEPAPTRPRNPQFEREATETAARGIIDPSDLIARMNARANALSGEYVSDPGNVALDRDRPREAREEIEDCLNHAIWWLEDSFDHPRALERQQSLPYLIAFYRAWTD